MEVTLGNGYRDTITGFVGIATGRAEYITGCEQILLTPKVKADGAFLEGRWLDIDRLEEIEAARPSLRKTANGPDKPAPIK